MADETLVTEKTSPEDVTQDEDEKSLLSGEEKKEEEKSDKTDKAEDGKADKAKVGAPDKYEDFNIPEGMELDKNLLEESLPVLKELGLSQEQAQKLVDLQAKYSVTNAERAAKAWKDTIDTWTKETKADKEYGGSNLNTTLSSAKAVIKEFGNDKFVEMLDFTGIGNHPEMVRFLHKISNQMKEDGILHGAAAGGKNKDPAKVMFPSMN